MMMELEDEPCHCKGFHTRCKEKYLVVCISVLTRTEIKDLDRFFYFRKDCVTPNDEKCVYIYIFLDICLDNNPRIEESH